MPTATKDIVLPTTVTDSWPRPSWFTESPNGRPVSEAMTDVASRERFVDAVSAVLSDQARDGLGGASYTPARTWPRPSRE
jgi:hypothetical protein